MRLGVHLEIFFVEEYYLSCGLEATAPHSKTLGIYFKMERLLVIRFISILLL